MDLTLSTKYLALFGVLGALNTDKKVNDRIKLGFGIRAGVLELEFASIWLDDDGTVYVALDMANDDSLSVTVFSLLRNKGFKVEADPLPRLLMWVPVDECTEWVVHWGRVAERMYGRIIDKNGSTDLKGHS